MHFEESFDFSFLVGVATLQGDWLNHEVVRDFANEVAWYFQLELLLLQFLNLKLLLNLEECLLVDLPLSFVNGRNQIAILCFILDSLFVHRLIIDFESNLELL